MKTKQELAGIYVASITAYDQAGNVDAAALQKLMQRNINEGAAGFFVGGSSGECFMLTEAERVQVFEAAAAYAGKTNLIAHVGAIGTAEAVRYAKAAMGMGNTHREFDVANPDYIQLFKSGAILGVKQTNYNLFQMERILNLNPDLIAFDGYDETMVAGQALGSSGSIGSTFNMMLPHYKKIFDLFDAGKREEALALQHKANNCMEAMCRVGLIPAIKYELARQGYPVGEARRPFSPLTDEQKAYVDGVLDEYLVK